MALISLRSVSVAFGGPPLLDGINLQLEAGERLCLMGRNGTGKSTLLKLINGEINPDGGEIFRQQGLKVALVSQEIPQGLAGTVFDVVAGGTGEGDAHLEDADGWRHHQAVERVLSRLKLDGEASFETLSGGTKRRAMLARALASTPGHPAARRTDQPPGHREHRVARGFSAQAGQDAAVRDARPGLRAPDLEPGRGAGPGKSLRLRLRLRRLRRAAGGVAGGGGRPAGALRQEAGRGGGLGAPGDQGAPHAQRGAGPGAAGAARGAGGAADEGRDGEDPDPGRRALRASWSWKRRGPRSGTAAGR